MEINHKYRKIFEAQMNHCFVLSHYFSQCSQRVQPPPKYSFALRFFGAHSRPPPEPDRLTAYLLTFFFLFYFILLNFALPFIRNVLFFNFNQMFTHLFNYLNLNLSFHDLRRLLSLRQKYDVSTIDCHIIAVFKIRKQAKNIKQQTVNAKI